MMMMRKFCGDSSNTSRPFHHGGYTYYTNNFYVLRIAGKTEDARQWKEIGDKDLARRCVQLFPTADELAEMRHAPHRVYRDIVTRCETCRGYGFTKICPHCEGEGAVEFKKDTYTYECECQRCDGSGVVAANRNEAGAERCSCCQGFGREVDERYFKEPERIGKARLSPDQMLRLSHLPLILWAAYGINGHFVFFGGEGVLLGIVKPEED